MSSIVEAIFFEDAVQDLLHSTEKLCRDIQTLREVAQAHPDLQPPLRAVAAAVQGMLAHALEDRPHAEIADTTALS